jgi:hypothetical protein
MDRNENKRLFSELLFGNFDKILAELNLVYKLTHNGEKGRESEEILRAFLKKFLPQKYKVGTGFVQTDEGISNQCDILVYDESNVPPLFSGYVNKIIRLISLRAVIECKMNLTTEDLKKVNDNFTIIKDLYRKDPEVKSFLKDEPLTVLFAYKKRGNIEKALENLPYKNVDLVFCGEGELYSLMNDGNEYTDNITKQLFSGTTLHGYDVTKGKQAFANFYCLFVDRLNAIKFDYSRVSMLYEYSGSSIYIDYEKEKVEKVTLSTKQLEKIVSDMQIEYNKWSFSNDSQQLFIVVKETEEKAKYIQSKQRIGTVVHYLDDKRYILISLLPDQQNGERDINILIKEDDEFVKLLGKIAFEDWTAQIIVVGEDLRAIFKKEIFTSDLSKTLVERTIKHIKSSKNN